MARGFCKQERCPRFHRVRNLSEKAARTGHFVHHRHGKYEIDLAPQILHAQRIGRGQARVGAFEESGFR